MIFLYLLLGHLIADFLLQPSRLIRLKFKHWYGILIHVLVHLVVITFLTLPYFLIQPSSTQFRIILAIVLIVASHFVIDFFKVNYEKKHQKYFIAFWLDQCSHYAIILATVLLIPTLIEPNLPANLFLNIALQTYLNPFVALYIIGLILATYTFEISRFEHVRERDHSEGFQLNRKKMIKHILTFSFLYLIFLFYINFIY